MYSRLRALERKLIDELAELVVTEQVDDLTGRWREAVEEGHSVPDTLDFARDIVRAGFPLPILSRAINYLAECFYNKAMPDPGSLFQVLLPWRTHPASVWY